MAPLLKKLIESRNWRGVNKRVNWNGNDDHISYKNGNINCFGNRTQSKREKMFSIELSIEYILKYGRGKHSLELLQKLFDARLRTLTRKGFCFKKKKKKKGDDYDDDDCEDGAGRFFKDAGLWGLLEEAKRQLAEKNGQSKFRCHATLKDQIFKDICCRGCTSGKGFLNLPTPVIELILEQHTKTFDSFFHMDVMHPNIETSKKQFVCSMWADYLDLSDYSSFINKEVEEKLLSVQQVENDMNKFKNPNISELLAVLERTALVINYRRKSISTTPLLHWIVMARYPPIIVWLVSKLLCPDQLKERGDKGRIPLHYAYKKPMRMGHFSSEFCNEIGIDMTTTPPSYVQLLVKIYPEGIRYADKQGKLPLAAYLENVPQYTRRGIQDIQFFISASPPEALTTRDPTSRLLPFLVPSIGRPVLPLSGHVARMTYEILRNDPTALSVALKNSNAENHHCEKKERVTFDSYSKPQTSRNALVARISDV